MALALTTPIRDAVYVEVVDASSGDPVDATVEATRAGEAVDVMSQRNIAFNCSSYRFPITFRQSRCVPFSKAGRLRAQSYELSAQERRELKALGYID